MPAIDEDLPAICRIPDLRRLVLATRGDALAIGGPRHRRHDINLPLIRVPAIDEDVSAICCVPDLNGAIQRAGGDAFAIGGPCCSRYP